MAGYRAALLNFTKGEISPELEARFDLSAYQVGLRRAENVKIRRTGGVAKRMGTRFVAECLADTTRLIPFQFSDEQGYALEFGQAYMRPLALGGAVLEEELEVIAITNAIHAQVTAHLHGYSVGEQVYFKNIEGMTQINDRWTTILTVPDDNNFTIDVDTREFGTFTGSGGGADRTLPPDPPPTPPVVPTPLPVPDPPDLGSGSGGGYVTVGGLPYWKTWLPDRGGGP